ncbi:MAG: BatA domain-containing protein, partial [Chitinophagales bacterium]|nr:BatA domain-containing protein [Chitinophagales bacterium]MBP9705944.1 BatA domain-containing protein [Chitinophagales bacterium]
MSFIYPNFLWALLLLGIPIIIHLFNFRRYRTVYFTNVRFLKNIQEETATKNRLKHLLVLLTRLLAITFLVFAFAQPFIPSESAESKPTSRAVSIYIDNSFSMETMQDGKRLFDIAKEKATEIADAYKVDDAFQLLTNDFEAGHQHLVNKEAFLQMLAQVNISPEVKTTDEILKRQKDI